MPSFLRSDFSKAVRRFALRFLLVGGFGMLFPSSVFSAPNDLRGRSEPGLILETGARMGNCDVLTFTPDGKRLLAVGDDKVARIWQVTNKGLVPDRVLRWQTWREHRGAIYALALSPDPETRQVAIAGLGARTGSVAVLDSITGRVVHGLTDVKGNDAVIWTLAFAPSGDRLVFGTNDGDVWLWNLAGAKKNDVHRIGTHDARPNPVRLVAFLTKTRLLSVARDGQVLLWDIAQPEAQPTMLFRFQVGPVFHAALSPDRRRLVAVGERHGRNSVEVYSLEDRTSKHLPPLDDDDLPHSIAFDPRGERLALGIRTVPQKAAFFKETDDKILIYDLTTFRAVRGPKPTFHAEAMAFHPDGRRFAVAGGDDHEVTLWDLRTPESPISTIRSPGSGLWGVRLSQKGDLLAYQTQRDPNPSDPNYRGRGPWRVFDLTRRAWANPDSFQPVEPLEQLAGWRVEPDKTDAYVWFVVSPENKRFPLPLTIDPDDMPRCHTFLRPAGEGQPVRLAVGHYWGLSVFELTAEGPRRVRLFTGHQSYVTSVAPDAKHQILVTSSRDQTIAAWSLADWRGQAALGAAFSVKLGKLLVDEVDPGSPAWEAGLARGDEIVFFAFDANQFLYDPLNKLKPADRASIGFRKVGPAADCLDQLRGIKPGKEYYFKVKRPQETKLLEIATRVRQRPLWCFFPTRDDQWVLWRFLDYYYDTSTRGDSLIGWQVNGADVDQTPAFYPARQFAERFHRRDKVAEALTQTRFAPERVIFPDLEPPELILAVDRAEVKEHQSVTVSFRVTPRGPRDFHRPDRLTLWIGDYRFKEWPRAALPADGHFQDKAAIPWELLRNGANRLTLQCASRGGALENQQVTVQKLAKEGQPTLYVLIVGVSDYSAVKAVPQGLKYANLPGVAVDVERMRDLWTGQKGRLFRDVRVFPPLENANATPAAILKLLKDTARTAQPDDLVVLYLGGHGYTEPEGQGDATKAGTFLFVGPNFDFQRPTETGLTSEDLYRALTEIRSRKLVLLNACHSGDATIRTLRDPVRDLTPGGVGPVVLSACDHKELAFVADEGSLFTRAMLEAFGRAKFAEADRNHDNQIDMAELVLFVRHRVPELLEEAKKRGRIRKEDMRRQQTPCFYPDQNHIEPIPVAQRKVD